jgi:antitoxin (DNA-binding transcriptional repressor) of toxin-antitoxin stability system
MRLSATEAKGQSTELIRRTESGEEVFLTRQGHAVVARAGEGGVGVKFSAGPA